MASLQGTVGVFTLVFGLSACTGDKDKAKLPPPQAPAAPAEAAAPAPAPAAAAADATEATAGQAQAPAAAPAPEPGTQVSANAPAPAAPAAPAAEEMKTSEYRLTGEVAAPRRSQIAFRVGGIVATIAAKPGTITKKGEVLATLDDRDFTLKVELAKARRDQAKVALDAADTELKREVQLKKEDASTATVYDRTKAAYDQAKLALRLAELDLQTNEFALKDTKLVAPYDSVVAAQLKYEGESLQAGTPVFEIYDTAQPEVTLSVPERLMGKIALGAKINIAVPSAGYQGPGEVVRLVPVISEKTRSFQITARLGSPDSRVVPGSYAEATLN